MQKNQSDYETIQSETEMEEYQTMHAQWICTTWDGRQAHTLHRKLLPEQDRGTEFKVINLYPEFTYQIFEGFGGAMTEAAAYTFSQMPPSLQQGLLDAYFGPDGLGYRYARISLDSCDFSLGHYEALKVPGDSELSSFTLERDEQYVIPFLHAAEQRLGQKIQLMLSPWSPPAWMKSNHDRNHGGYLLPQYRSLWASYICRYIREYQKRGFEVKMLTVQNEPNATQTWDSCRYTAEEEKEFLRDFLYPEMERQGLQVEIYIWDHNKERAFERAEAILDDETRGMVSGVAVHWYTGDHFEALGMLRERFPEKKLVFTEGCVEYSRFRKQDMLKNARMYAHDIIGNLNHGLNLFLDWNILLDEHGGPNHVKNFCDAPVMFHAKNLKLEKKLSYYYIGHLSRFIKQGAQRIGLSRYTDMIDATAFRNPDGELVMVAMNRTSEPMPMNVRIAGQVLITELPSDAIATLLIRDI